jgi:hypothetical protein
MHITLSNSTTNPQKTHLQTLFDNLWRDVKNKQQANARLRIELSELHKIYHKKILPVEQLTEGPYSQLAQRLIEFFTRKSLTQWQRHELSQWIIECINYIELLNPEKSRELTVSYQQVLANYLKIDVEDVEQQMNHGAGSLDEFFADFDTIEEAFQCFSDNFADNFAENPSKERENPKSGFQEELFGFSEDDPKVFRGGPFEELFTPGIKAEEQDLVNDQWLRSIFRRTANALHPDKERNEALRSEKQNLMAQLLAAREEKDVFSLLNLYMQYVEGSDLLITDETMGKLCAQLNKQKNQLTEEKQEILYESPMYSELYKKLHSRNKKKREKNIERHIRGVRESTQEMLEFVVSLRNLKILKIHLEHRYEEHFYEEHGHVDYADNPFEFYDA